MKSNDKSEEIYDLWDELCDYGVHACDDAVKHCMDRLCQWIGADHAFWLGSIRLLSGAKARKDSMFGWRVGSLCMLDASRENRPEVHKGIRDIETDNPCDTSRAIASQAGTFRVYSLLGGKLVDLEAFSKTEHYDYFYRSMGVVDRIWGVFPVNNDAESYFCFDSMTKGHAFCSRDVQLVARVLRGIKWLHRQMMLSHGLHVCEEPLTASERRLLRALLTGASEKDIAGRLYLSPGTVHQYAVRVYRKFGVRGRLELMALWMNALSSPAK